MDSFYGQTIIKNKNPTSVFISENGDYHLAFIYSIDQERFDSEYEKEGFLFQNLQMPMIYTYIKREGNSNLDKDKKLDENDEPIKEVEEIVIKDDTEEDRSKAFIFVLCLTSLLSNGKIMETWKTKEGRTAFVYREISGKLCNMR